ncbi:MAG: ribosome silencing factor [Lachnospiraceae bacterium]|nr:ribosome silencing factor [Lachnospiraceae bacterium]
MSEQVKMAKIAYNALDEKKGEDIKIIDISGISVMADYFIIANGNSITQVQALVDNVEEKMNQSGFQMKRKEGNRSSTWVLLDFGDVVVHVFDNEDRLFYDLERIWSDGKTVGISALED